MSIQELIAIYAEYGVEVDEAEAASDLARAMSDNPDEARLLKRIRGYAAEQAMCNEAEGREAEEFESNYR